MRARPYLPLSLAFIFSNSAFAQEDAPPDPSKLRPINPLKELLIIDPAVVDSERTNYPGAFSIGHLFDQIAGENGDGATLMRQWLGTWEETIVVNGDTVEPRLKIRELILEPWQRADGWSQDSKKPWLPNLENAPFQLLAIVNRLDLGNLGPVYYGSSDLRSEGRLIYAAIDPDGKPLGHHFTVILEYQLTDNSNSLTKTEVANTWHSLGNHRTFNEHYLKALEKVTRTFTDRRRNKDGKELPTQLAQIRTNEMALAETCEMREYHFEKETSSLMPAPLAQTPRMEYAVRPSPANHALLKFVNDNSSRLQSGSLRLPEKITYRKDKEIPLLAGSCTVPDPNFFWETGGVGTRELRRVFSQRTCNGCHARDTNTEFCHIRPRLKGQPSELSKFLSLTYNGIAIEDPGQFAITFQSHEMRDRVSDFLKSIHPKIERNDLERLTKESLTAN